MRLSRKRGTLGTPRNGGTKRGLWRSLFKILSGYYRGTSEKTDMCRNGRIHIFVKKRLLEGSSARELYSTCVPGP